MGLYDGGGSKVGSYDGGGYEVSSDGGSEWGMYAGALG